MITQFSCNIFPYLRQDSLLWLIKKWISFFVRLVTNEITNNSKLLMMTHVIGNCGIEFIYSVKWCFCWSTWMILVKRTTFFCIPSTFYIIRLYIITLYLWNVHMVLVDGWFYLIRLRDCLELGGDLVWQIWV